MDRLPARRLEAAYESVKEVGANRSRQRGSPPVLATSDIRSKFERS